MEASDVLSFWFEQERKRWFEKSHAFDGEIRYRVVRLSRAAFGPRVTPLSPDAGSLSSARDELSRAP